MTLLPSLPAKPKISTCEQYPHLDGVAEYDTFIERCDDVKIANDASGHRTVYRVRTPDSQFRIELIEPATKQTGDVRTFLHIPGLSEDVEHDFARKRTLGIAQRVPTIQRAITLGHNGMGYKGGEDKTCREVVADERNRIAAALLGRHEKAWAMGSSMGYAVLSHMLMQDPAYDLDGLIGFGPAAQSEENLTIKLRADFGIQLITDTGRDLVRHSPLELGRDSNVIRRWLGNTARSTQPIFHQVHEFLERPLDVNEYLLAVEGLRTLIIYGSKEKIVDRKLYGHHREAHPNHIIEMIVSGKGHELLNDHRLSAQIVGNAVLSYW